MVRRHAAHSLDDAASFLRATVPAALVVCCFACVGTPISPAPAVPRSPEPSPFAPPTQHDTTLPVRASLSDFVPVAIGSWTRTVLEAGPDLLEDEESTGPLRFGPGIEGGPRAAAGTASGMFEHAERTGALLSLQLRVAPHLDGDEASWRSSAGAASAPPAPVCGAARVHDQRAFDVRGHRVLRTFSSHGARGGRVQCWSRASAVLAHRIEVDVTVLDVDEAESSVRPDPDEAVELMRRLDLEGLEAWGRAIPRPTLVWPR